MGRYPSYIPTSSTVGVTKNKLQRRPYTNPNCNTQLSPSNYTPTFAPAGYRPPLHYDFHGNVLNLMAEKIIVQSLCDVDKMRRIPSNMGANRNVDVTKTTPNAAPTPTPNAATEFLPKIPPRLRPPLAAAPTALPFTW